ncbi:hypothetical protein OCOJLMKI_4837 [Methylobacterium iners]|uniref:Lipoprotein n=1 Tax=Methylobacterium iners TaxID=418707 RepID=A0ABQ4S6V4_9HYPH|nr:hypothetical protein OCOJLMKI_4837 [Methylobacterium iners]
MRMWVDASLVLVTAGCQSIDWEAGLHRGLLSSCRASEDRQHFRSPGEPNPCRTEASSRNPLDRPPR